MCFIWEMYEEWRVHQLIFEVDVDGAVKQIKLKLNVNEEITKERGGDLWRILHLA